MYGFEPDVIPVRSGHFFGGQRIEPAGPRIEFLRPSDGRPDAAIPAGTVWVNRGRSNDFILPSGGDKKSGIGKDPGRAAIDANLRQKMALIEF